MLLFKYLTLFVAGIWFLLKSTVVVFRYNYNPFSPIFVDEDWVYRWKRGGHRVAVLPRSAFYRLWAWNDTVWKRLHGKGDREVNLWELLYCGLCFIAGIVLTIAFFYMLMVCTWLAETEMLEG